MEKVKVIRLNAYHLFFIYQLIYCTKSASKLLLHFIMIRAKVIWCANLQRSQLALVLLE